MADQDLEELKQLEGNIAKLEAAMVANPERRTLLGAAIDGMRQRVAELDKKIKEKEERAFSEKANEAAIREAVAKETALNASEKEAYCGFLEKAFFTKQDFGALDKFYSESWDKLTDDGKAEISYRVWEGVRRGEYKFSELPEVVRKKESERLHEILSKDQREWGNLTSLPEKDRADFISAHQSGDQVRVDEVLNRDSFKNSVSTKKPDTISHAEAARTGETDKAILANLGSASTPDAEKNPASEKKPLPDFKDINLDGLALAESKEATKPDIAKTGQASGRSYS